MNTKHGPGSTAGLQTLKEYALPFLSFASCLLRTISSGLWASGETWQQKGLGAENLPNDIDLAGS